MKSLAAVIVKEAGMAVRQEPKPEVEVYELPQSRRFTMDGLLMALAVAGAVAVLVLPSLV